MRKLIFLHVVILKKINALLALIATSSLFFASSIYAGEKWGVDKELSTISFELPVLFAKNVRGTFKNIEGFIEIDLDKKKNNKAIFSVVINSIDMNYAKYRDLLLSDIFFDAKQFPIAVVDTKKFSYQNEKKITLDVEVTIKDKSEIVPLTILVKRLGEELVQIETELSFSRTFFNIGTGKWSNTTILKDKATIKTNLFLFKE
ncbi:MAG: YceI family protein [Pelagibacteraceae bacterium]|nr:YceI family protein [Pelagibacteraceae bacterium]HJL58112.1 YceI family protein [Alphaproteobacteria bacterium]MBO6467182.1 YceI family protein [Pelagibacteraceae bacterium]MBO6469372.1 YceI family protein [Pelagibacteraceae bacterium]MBO6470571.1 YceI family protein [Pelagibacteraceae bacterium]